MIKNKIIIFIGVFACLGARADVADYLDAQLLELTAKRDKLKTELADCEKNTRGFKIAGISTLAATGVGVYANVRLAQEIKKAEISGGAGGGRGGGGAAEVGNDPCANDTEGICDWERNNCLTQVDPSHPDIVNCKHGCGGQYCCAYHGCECWYQDRCKAEYPELGV